MLACLLCLSMAPAAQSTDAQARASANLQSGRMSARHQAVQRIEIVQQRGARPRFSPDGSVMIFDRLNDDEFYDLYLGTREGRVIRSLTEGRQDLPQRNNGNGRVHPSGAFVVFVSEEASHFGGSMRRLGDPGIGLFSNFRATTAEANGVWRLTNIDIKKGMFDRTVAKAAVNPVFSPDGRTFVWTERYASGGNHNWGRWRIKAADVVVRSGQPELQRERDLYTPKGSYATAMAFLDSRHLLFSGNPEGQHEYGMDQYILDLDTNTVKNLTNTPGAWEEGSCVAPNGRIVYMTNIASRFPLDFKEANWAGQPTERDYYIMDGDGGNKERLTFFNDPSSPEYVGGRAIVAACDISPDGRFLAGTLGVDVSTGKRAELVLKVIVAEFRTPLKA